MRRVDESKVTVQMVCEAIRLDREYVALLDQLSGLDRDARNSYADDIDAKRDTTDAQIKHVIARCGSRGWDYIDTLAECGKLALCLMVDEDAKAAA